MAYVLTAPYGGTVTIESETRKDVLVSRGYTEVVEDATPTEEVVEEKTAPKPRRSRKKSTND